MIKKKIPKNTLKIEVSKLSKYNEQFQLIITFIKIIYFLFQLKKLKFIFRILMKVINACYFHFSIIKLHFYLKMKRQRNISQLDKQNTIPDTKSIWQPQSQYFVSRNISATQQKSLLLKNVKFFLQNTHNIKGNQILDSKLFNIHLPILNIIQFQELYEEVSLKLSKINKLKKNWSKDQIQIMLWIVRRYTQHNCLEYDQLNLEHWKKISPLLFGRKPIDCMFKFLSLQKHNLADNPWTKEEQKLLEILVEEKGQRWLEISKQLYLRNECRIFRTGKQCRQHWICFMNPTLKKGYWTKKEDFRLLDQFLKVGRKWSQISKVLGGRNQNSIKNRFVFLVENQAKNLNIEISKDQFQIKVQEMRDRLMQDELDQNVQTQIQEVWENRQNYSFQQKNNQNIICASSKEQQGQNQTYQSELQHKSLIEIVNFDDVGTFLNLGSYRNLQIPFWEI